VPAHLAATSVATSLAGALIFWVAMGVIFGWVNTRLFGANS
jgi:predicted cobalt transporter CbtA